MDYYYLINDNLLFLILDYLERVANKPETLKKNSNIIIKGAQQHNLKKVDLEVASNELTVITGPSGSGKSSLAFHTLYAEGQRRYVETFSPYVRQFMDRMDKPLVDSIDGIPPAIAIEQKNSIRTTRSTVGTLTELNDYLKALFPRLSKAFDPETGEEIKPDSPESILKWATDTVPTDPILITFEVKVPQNTSAEETLLLFNQQGYLRIFHQGEVIRTDASDIEPSLKLGTKIEVIQDRIKTSNKKRFTEAIEVALQFGKSNCILRYDAKFSKKKEFTTQWYNPNTGFILKKPTPSMFSFNSPLGACEECRGFGKTIGIDLKKSLKDPNLSIEQGCIKPFEGKRGSECKNDLILCCQERGVSVTAPWYTIDPVDQQWILHGEKGSPDELEQAGRWYGVRGFFEWMEAKSYKMQVRIFLSRYRAYTECKVCSGSRLKPDSLCFKINGKTLPDLWKMPISTLIPWLKKIKLPKDDKTTKHALDEVQSRTSYLEDVGLGYLTLDRAAKTLSGGEIERVNLTTCLGASLTNTLFVLDEPTVGLHSRDIHRLISIMHNLKDKGNTVVVVEHEEAVMKAADNIIDMGPEAGENGGEIVAVIDAKKGLNLSSLKKHPNSTTLPYLVGKKKIPIPLKKRIPKTFIKIDGAHCHNIKNLDISIPLGTFTVLSGVSGSGKSSLANNILYRNLLEYFHLPCEEEVACISSIKGADNISGVDHVDQSPLTRTPRSTPAVYSGAFDAIRELFTLSDEAKSTNIKAGYFSFNAGVGRCQRCAGNGYEKVEMQFLSDLFITCPECQGKRYNQTALEYLYQEKNISEVLQMTISEAMVFFAPEHNVKSKTNTLKTKIINALTPNKRVGLGYLRLGQPLNTLSGGESQRLKLCQLLKISKGAGRLLILDEPTTGLHFSDIEKLLEVFQDLVDAGHSLLVIEHQTDVIKAADYLIDMGPGAGEHGGNIVFTGSPETLLTSDSTSETALALADKKSNTKKPLSKNTGNNGQIEIFGAREHNLKNIDVSIPRDEIVVVTGLSGSGKSTLSFDIIFAEGQRRFMDSMSPYARQFTTQLEKPDIDKIEGLPPTVAIEQRVSRGGGKSTVGTVTEVYHFFRLLYAKLGTQFCPISNEAVVTQTVDSIIQQVKKIQKADPSTPLLAQLVKAKKGFHTDIALAAAKKGIKQLLVDDILIEIDDFTPLARYKEHDIYAIIPQSKVKINDAVEKALLLGKGIIAIAQLSSQKKKVNRKMQQVIAADDIKNFSTKRVSPVTGKSFEEPDPHHFSFNSQHGWCTECRGYGKINTEKPKKKRGGSRANQFNSLTEEEIAEEQLRSKDTDSVFIPCPTCEGQRLREESRHIRIHDLNIGEACHQTVNNLQQILKDWKFDGRDGLIARDIIPEITQRLKFLTEVGLGYLSLDRSADTLSGGESQRIRLAAQLGSNLQGVLYILDEPTIGLHPRDNHKLLNTLELLRDRGNSLLIVEHDDETMQRAAKIIDLGPGAGVLGGEIIAELEPKHLTDPDAIKKSPNSSTLKALTDKINHPIKGKRRTLPKVAEKEQWLIVNGCNYNNLQNIDVRIPLRKLTVISGVSGCGKSSFMRGTLAKVAKGELPVQCTSNIDSDGDSNNVHDTWAKASGFDSIKHCFEVDQTPIGKTSRSCPATYVKVLDEIRKLFAQLPESKMRGYSAGRFSFNNAEGQCPECKGNGRIKLEMDFLPTTWISCETCREMRYNDATLEVRYNSKSMGDILKMNIAEASEFFTTHQKISRTLNLLAETGLGYLQLGQPSQTLSGGEAQRIKLVAELTKGRVQKLSMKPAIANLYLIEEPTIGLHQEDVKKLIDVLHRLVDEGHTVVVIEHHTSIMAEADYLIDMGPEAGNNGGIIVAQGTPEKVAKSKKSITAPFLMNALS